MTASYLKVSAKMAAALGLFLPIAETIRRMNQITDYRYFFNWVDDYILGAGLLWSAFLVFRDKKNSVAYLIAAWGVAAGALFLSFIAQFKYDQMPPVEAGIFSVTFVTIAKGIILVYIFIGLIKAIKANEP